MSTNFRFGIISDPHIALPETIWDSPNRFHLVEVSIPALEFVLAELATLNLDFLLLPGDLTQHGESLNHTWLAQRLAQLPYPSYVVPGNHDVITAQGGDRTLSLPEFVQVYQEFGYTPRTAGAFSAASIHPPAAQPYYAQEVMPQVWLIGLNSIAFDAEGHQLYTGMLDAAQLRWLEKTLAELAGALVMVMVHHNVIEHLPGQAEHGMGRRYMLQNAPELRRILEAAAVPLLFTGHLHVQDVAHQAGLWEVTTGSLVSFPHPYRVMQMSQDTQGRWQLSIESGRVRSLPQWENLAELSREWMGDRSFPFMTRLLTEAPINTPPAQAATLAADLRYFWADISAGDALFDFSHFPPAIGRYLERFSATDASGNPHPIDNQTILELGKSQESDPIAPIPTPTILKPLR